MPLYQDEFLWRKNADVRVDFTHPADRRGKSGFLNAGDAAPPQASRTEVLSRHGNLLAKKQDTTRLFVERASDRFAHEFDGFCFDITDPGGTNPRPKAYLPAYDDFLRTKW